MDPIIAYLKTSEFPRNKTEARILRMKAAGYVIYDDKLYRKGYSMLLLVCVTLSEENYIIREIYKGICKNHTGGQSLVVKALYKDITSKTMKSDCMEFTKKCDKCQRFAPMSKAHPKKLTTITSP